MMIKSLLLLVTGIAAQTTTETSSFNPNTGSYCPSHSHHYKPTKCWEGHRDWKHFSSCSDGEWKKDHHRCLDGKKDEFWCDKDQKWKQNKKECFKKCEKKWEPKKDCDKKWEPKKDCDKKWEPKKDCDKKWEPKKECEKPVWKDDCKKWDDHKHCFVPCQNVSVPCPCPSVCTSQVVVLPTSQAVAPVNAVAVSCPPCTTVTTQVPAPLRCNTVVICNPVLSNCPRPTGTVTFTLAPSSSASA